MTKWWAAALVAACLSPVPARALEIKNMRSTYGAFGAVRTDARILPGDLIALMYDIEGLKVDPKTRKASLLTIMQLVDSADVIHFTRENPMDVQVTLGGDRVPGELRLIIPPQQKPGKYKVKLKVTDRAAKETKLHEYPFEVMPPAFGFIGVKAPAVGLPGDIYLAEFALVNFKLDNKKPKAEIHLRVLDDSGKDLSLPLLQQLPRDLPPDSDLTKQNFVPMPFPIYLNRPGRFILAIDAEDKNAKLQAKLRIPFTVMDLGQASSK
ncbi:MAG: hypothetical protein FJ271_00875 [Planctomycetes bacterium]|nr:hypothetical protein [Planctomycetota bacterium]